jgi:hypothetical protein
VFNLILTIGSISVIVMMTVMAVGYLHVDGVKAERDAALVISGFKAYESAARIAGFGPGNMPVTVEQIEDAVGMTKPALRDGGVWDIELATAWDAGRIVICAAFPIVAPPASLVERAFSPDAFLPDEDCGLNFPGGGYGLILDLKRP